MHVVCLSIVLPFDLAPLLTVAGHFSWKREDYLRAYEPLCSVLRPDQIVRFLRMITSAGDRCHVWREQVRALQCAVDRPGERRHGQLLLRATRLAS
jgi:hypothetical protein